MKNKIITPLLIAIIFYSVFSESKAQADLFGADVAVLSQILIQAVAEVRTMTQVLGSAQDTASVLQEMNRGVKDVLRLADTAHVPLPPEVYENAKQIDLATRVASDLYGTIGSNSPQYTQTNYKSGVEALYLSEDAFEYSTFLDEQGTKVKSAAVAANEAAATKLTAETLGVLLHAVSHSNRIEAKELEISSTNRIESTSRDNADFQSFIDTETSIENDMRQNGFNSLNPIGDGTSP